MKPGDFLLGVFEFFAILLPGSLATWLAVQYVPEAVLKKTLTFGLGSASSPDTVVLGTAFLVSSYTLGHFVFMAGAKLDGLMTAGVSTSSRPIAMPRSKPRSSCTSRSTKTCSAGTSPR